MGIRLLGPLELEVHRTVVPLPAAKERAVLATLALRPGHPVPRSTLAAVLWGDDLSPAWTKGLQVIVSRVRRHLADRGVPDTGRLLRFTQDHYVLDLPQEQVDAHRFVALAQEGRARLDADPASAAELLDAALALWRGMPLPDLADSDLGRAEATRLVEAREIALEDRVDAALALGHHEDAVVALEPAVADQPLRERRWGQLVIALYRSGRQGEALRAYQRAREVLRDELGIEPGPALRRLEAAVLAHDPSLDPPSTGGSRVGPTARRAHVATSRVKGPPGVDLGAVSIDVLRELRTQLPPDDPMQDRIRATLVPALMWAGEWEAAVEASRSVGEPPG